MIRVKNILDTSPGPAYPPGMNTTSNATQTIEQIMAEEREAHAKWQRETMHGRWTIADLAAAFEPVSPAGNWKNPIDAIVPADRLEITKAAITFYVGGACEVLPAREADARRIRNAGYYANIGA